MSLSERAEAGPTRTRATTCSIGTLLASLPDAEREALQQMLADQRWPHQGEGSIAEALEAEGYTGDFAVTQIGVHRRGGCNCEREHVAS